MSMSNNVIRNIEVFLINHNIHAEYEFPNLQPSAREHDEISICLELKIVYYIL